MTVFPYFIIYFIYLIHQNLGISRMESWRIMWCNASVDSPVVLPDMENLGNGMGELFDFPSCVS